MLRINPLSYQSFYFSNLKKNLEKFSTSLILLEKYYTNFLLEYDYDGDSLNTYFDFYIKHRSAAETHLDSIFYYADLSLDVVRNIQQEDSYQSTNEIEIEKYQSFLEYHITLIRNRIAHPELIKQIFRLSLPSFFIPTDYVTGFCFKDENHHMRCFNKKGRRLSQRHLSKLNKRCKKCFHEIINNTRFKKIFANFLLSEFYLNRPKKSFLSEMNVSLEYIKLIEDGFKKSYITENDILVYIGNLFQNWQLIKPGHLEHKTEYEHKFEKLSSIICSMLNVKKIQGHDMPYKIFKDVDFFENEKELVGILNEQRFHILNQESLGHRILSQNLVNYLRLILSCIKQ